MAMTPLLDSAVDPLLQHDDANRARALALSSFIVEAPAGAGKTELLTQRYLRLLATVDEPEEIIAITFTNKAAGEMRERILHSLSQARQGVPPEAAHKRITFALAGTALARAEARNWQLEQQPGRLRLTTIDALCASLARQMPLLSRFGTQPAVADDTRRHYDEAARRTLAHMYGDPGNAASEAVTNAVASVLAHLDNDTGRFTRLLADMLARREQWQAIGALDHPESAISEALQAMIVAELQQLVAVFDARWQASLMPLARFAANALGEGLLLDWVEPLAAEPGDLPRWRAVADMLLTQGGEKRKRLTKNEGFPAEEKARKADMQSLLDALSERQLNVVRRVRDLPEIDHSDDAIVRALVRVLKLAAAELWLVFRERGEVDFAELAMRAMAALGDHGDPGDQGCQGDQGENTTGTPSDLALRLDYQIRHLLVDEFQDTSPTQIALLERLTAGWQAGDGRTLFLVGDPMQSIYRFRKADVGLFLRVVERGIGGVALESLRLSRNNRSDPAVVEWINTHFPAIFPPLDEPLAGEIRYRQFVATRTATDDAGVTVHALVSSTEDDKASVQAAEAERLIAIISAEWQRDPTRQIAVLVRAREHLQALVAALRRHPAGWRFSAVDVEPLLGRQSVQDLLSLTHALHHRGDRVHWLAVLRAPWCGLTLTDLHALAADDPVSTVWSLMNQPARVAKLSADGQQRLARVREVMAEALAGQGRQARRRWVEHTWRKLGGVWSVSGSGVSGMADAQAFFRRLETLDRAGRFVLDTLEDDMRALFAAADAQSDGRLQLMTIHKSKGLEFDTVILPGLHRVLPDNDTPLLVWDTFLLDDREHLAAAPINPRRARGALPTTYDFLRRIERRRGDNEDARVLYVAATRAIRRLHLVGVATLDRAGMPKNPRAGSALGRLWPMAQSYFSETAATASSSSHGSAASTVPSSGDELASYVPPLLRLPTGILKEASEGWQAPTFNDGSYIRKEAATEPFAAAVGTLVHACLEHMVADGGVWSLDAIRARQGAFTRWLSSRGWPLNDAEQGAANAVAMLCTTVASESGRWVLSAQQDGAAEMALANVAAGGSAQIQVIDRCFIADGVRWIVDYKTANLGENVTVERMVEHAQRYRDQLQRYADLFAGEGLPICCAILYVAHGKLIRLDECID